MPVILHTEKLKSLSAVTGFSLFRDALAIGRTLWQGDDGGRHTMGKFSPERFIGSPEMWRWLALLTMALLCLAGCAGRGRWVSASDKEAWGKMAGDLRGARVIFVGEFHDQRAHHDLQLRVLRELQQAKVPLAVGLEMFDHESQPALDQWVGGSMPLAEFVARYRQNWTIDWAQYDTILLFARNSRVPLVALNAPADLVQKVAHQGVSTLSPADRARLPAGVSLELDADYRAFLAGVFAGHGGGRQFENFAAAQALRNGTMARLIQSYLVKEPTRTMVVITGIGHAMKRGVAGLVARQSGLPCRVIIPVSSEALLDSIDEDEADWFVVE